MQTLAGPPRRPESYQETRRDERRRRARPFGRTPRPLAAAGLLFSFLIVAPARSRAGEPDGGSPIAVHWVNHQEESEPRLERIEIGPDGESFVTARSGRPLVVWGVNYDHDADGQLLEDYWDEHWETIEEDFAEIRALNANVVRVHLQLPRFMDSAEQPNEANLERLADLVELAERTGLYLDITGLGCYHKQDVPEWYDALDEAARWQVQARFWKAVAEVCRESPAIFCYDLMNEPVLPGEEPETEWLTGELGGKHFVQRIALDLRGRTRQEVARQWVEQLTGAIRELDSRTLVTVGVIPWAHVFPNAKPLFHSPEVGQPLDFVSVHFYPKTGEVDRALEALRVYQLGKPLVVEEIFPLNASLEETAEFIDEASSYVDGWISFYWGKTADEYRQQEDLQGAIIAKWLEYFQSASPLGERE